MTAPVIPHLVRGCNDLRQLFLAESSRQGERLIGKDIGAECLRIFVAGQKLPCLFAKILCDKLPRPKCCSLKAQPLLLHQLSERMPVQREQRLIRPVRAQKDYANELRRTFKEMQQMLMFRLEVLTRRRLPSAENGSKRKWQRLKPLFETRNRALTQVTGERTAGCGNRFSDAWSGGPIGPKLSAKFPGFILKT